MKLLINGLSLKWPHVGLGVYTQRLIQGLGRSTWQSDVSVAVDSECSLDYHYFKGRIETVRLKTLGQLPHSLLHDLIWQEMLAYRFCGEEELIFHSPTPFSSLCSFENSVVTWHDCIPSRLPQYLGRKGIRRILYHRQVDALKRYRAIIAVSEFTKRELINLYNVPSERVVVIPNHLPGEYLPQPKCGIHLRMRYSLPEKYWLYVGGYDFRKNVDFLLRSYSMALKDKDLPKLVLAGKIPPDDAYCCTPVMSIVAELGLNEHVIFSGFVQTEDLPFVYSNASLLIYPSQMEGFGLPPLEAMGCGCTAICTNGSSLNEVITDSSHRFEIDNFKPLSMMMLSAASGDLPFNPSFDRNNFSEERTIKKYTSLINTLAG